MSAGADTPDCEVGCAFCSALACRTCAARGVKLEGGPCFEHRLEDRHAPAPQRAGVKGGHPSRTPQPASERRRARRIMPSRWNATRAQAEAERMPWGQPYAERTKRELDDLNSGRTRPASWWEDRRP